MDHRTIGTCCLFAVLFHWRFLFFVSDWQDVHFLWLTAKQCSPVPVQWQQDGLSEQTGSALQMEDDGKTLHTMSESLLSAALCRGGNTDSHMLGAWHSCVCGVSEAGVRYKMSTQCKEKGCHFYTNFKSIRVSIEIIDMLHCTSKCLKKYIWPCVVQ